VKLKKILLILFLIMAFSIAIGAVNAAKYIDDCDGGDKKHKTTWDRKWYSVENKGIVQRGGKKYVESLNIYLGGITGCNHKSHKIKPYKNGGFEPRWSNGKLVYNYKLAKWKRYDSWSIISDKTYDHYVKQKKTFVAYSEGPNNIKIVVYSYRKSDNKRVYSGASYYTRTENYYTSTEYSVRSYYFDTGAPPYTGSYYLHTGNFKQFCKQNTNSIYKY